MPYLKSKDIRGTPLCSLKYICNDEKTNGGLLVTAVNCIAEPKCAYEEMKRVYEFYSGRSFNEPIPQGKKGKVKLIHYIQSFDPQDNVSANKAHDIAKTTVSEIFGKNVQAVIATHNDKEHIHNHIIVNVYDITGKRFYSNQTTLKRIKQISDKACLRYGIQPYDKSKTPKPKISAYNEWEHKKKGTSWKQQLRDRLDELVSTSANLEELLKTLEQSDFEIKRGKYISVRAPGQERFVRTKTLGDDYTEENLVKRIEAARAERENSSGEKFRDGYYGVYDSLRQKSGAYRDTKPVVVICNFYYGQYTTLVREKLNSIEAVKSKLAEAEKTMTEAQAALDTATADCDKAEQIIKKAEHYFNVMKGVQKIFPKSEKDKVAVAIVKEYGFKSIEAVKLLKESVEEKKCAIAALRDNLNAASTEVKKYRNIVDTFDMMNSGEDYISRLMREAKDKCDREDWDNVIRYHTESIRKQISDGRITVYGTMQKNVAEMIMKLSDSVSQGNTKLRTLIHTLAVMQADDITSDSGAAKLIGQMKTSEKSAAAEKSAITKEAKELDTPINRADVYVRFKDKDYPNRDFFDTCRNYAVKYDATDKAGYGRLVAKRQELRDKADEKAVREYYYSARAGEYAKICEVCEKIGRDGYLERAIEAEREAEMKKQSIEETKKKQRRI